MEFRSGPVDAGQPLAILRQAHPHQSGVNRLFSKLEVDSLTRRPINQALFRHFDIIAIGLSLLSYSPFKKKKEV